MQKFTSVTGVVATMDRSNVDTDQIIPKQFLKRIERTGFGQFLFYDWRFNEDGTDNPDFELNRVDVKGASIFVTRHNFGSGSSREHAVWALDDFGIRCVIAASFADIFFNNCFQNGLLAIQLDEAVIDQLFKTADENAPFQMKVDLEKLLITDALGTSIPFEVDPIRRENMLQGLDNIAQTLLHADKISEYEAKHEMAPAS